jgi:hypothetical protein
MSCESKPAATPRVVNQLIENNDVESTNVRSSRSELNSLDPEIVPVLEDHASASRLLELLPSKYSPTTVLSPSGARAWELAGLWFLNRNRGYEAVSLFWRLHQQMHEGQSVWCHKGQALVWLSESYVRLGFPVHAKRYLMLTLCEDALRAQRCASAAPSHLTTQRGQAHHARNDCLGGDCRGDAVP